MSDLDKRLRDGLVEPVEPFDAEEMLANVRRRKTRRHILVRTQSAALVVLVIVGVTFGIFGLSRIFHGKGSGQAPGGQPAGGTNWIFFTQSKQGASLLFAVHADGTGLRQITPAGSYNQQDIDYGASLSPNGARLAYVSVRGTSHSIVISDFQGPIKAIPVDVSSPPVWSPDGKMLAFSGGGTNTSDSGINLMTYDVSTGKTHQVTFGQTQWDGMIWSADGQSLIAIHDNRPSGVSIERVPIDGQSKHQVLWSMPTPKSAQGTVPFPVIASGELSPDGTRVLHETANTQPTKFQITDLATGATQDVNLGDSSGNLWASGWSPDGQSLVLNGNLGSGPDGIWISNTDGSDLHPVVAPVTIPMNGVGAYPTWGFQPNLTAGGDNATSPNASSTGTQIASGTVKSLNWVLDAQQNRLVLRSQSGTVLATAPAPSPDLSFARYDFPLEGANVTVFFGEASSRVSSAWLFISQLPSNTNLKTMPNEPGTSAWWQVDVPGTGPGQAIALDDQCRPIQAIDILTGGDAGKARYTYCKVSSPASPTAKPSASMIPSPSK